MRTILLFVLLASGCTVRLEDQRIDPSAISKILNQHDINIAAINGYIKNLQDSGVLPKTESKKEN
jgi:predicted transcriptional regulator